MKPDIVLLEGCDMTPPFPGMDPYLEGELWGSFHGDLIVEVRRQLIPQLAPRYYPFTEKYFLVESPELGIVDQKINPDVGIARQSTEEFSKAKSAVAIAPLQMELPSPRPRRARKLRLAIRDREKRKLVTVIEFLSPANKTGDSRLQYLAKRELILASSVNLVEIDLLHHGQRLPMRKPLPDADYFMMVSRSWRRRASDVWPVSLEDPLPPIPIPLRKKDTEVILNLQLAVASVYHLADFGSLVDYRKPPEAPLSPKQAAWLDLLLRKAGLREQAERS